LNSEEIISYQIDLYLNGLLSEEEKLIFEEKINQDATLASKVNEARLVNDVIYYASLVELKNTVGKDIKNIKYKTSPNWKNITYISASVVILLGLATYYLIPSKSSKQDTNTPTSITNSIQQVPPSDSTISGEAVDPSKKNKTQKTTSDSINIKVTPNTTSDNITYSPVNKDQPASFIQDNVKKDTLPIVNHSTNTNSTFTKIVCDKVFKINTTPSCQQKPTGQIQIEADKSYTYNFSIDQVQQSGYHALFSNIAVGTHNIMITYNKECVYKEKVIVPEKWCGLNESYSFNPEYNEKWILNYEQGSSGTYVIYDPSGNIIYGDNFGYGVAEWNGIDRQGLTVPAGVYFAFINYSDGRKERVELTIIR
jgi:hypothetical protein